MAILGAEKSEIEVRLYKLPHNGPKPTYFDEYAALGERDKHKRKIMRYIVPKDGTYGIEITFKAGFDHGKYNGSLGVQVRDAASGVSICEKSLLHQSRMKERSLRQSEFKIRLIPPCHKGPMSLKKDLPRESSSNR